MHTHKKHTIPYSLYQARDMFFAWRKHTSYHYSIVGIVIVLLAIAVYMYVQHGQSSTVFTIQSDKTQPYTYVCSADGRQLLDTTTLASPQAFINNVPYSRDISYTYGQYVERSVEEMPSAPCMSSCNIAIVDGAKIYDKRGDGTLLTAINSSYDLCAPGYSVIPGSVSFVLGEGWAWQCGQTNNRYATDTCDVGVAYCGDGDIQSAYEECDPASTPLHCSQDCIVVSPSNANNNYRSADAPLTASDICGFAHDSTLYTQDAHETQVLTPTMPSMLCAPGFVLDKSSFTKTQGDIQVKIAGSKGSLGWTRQCIPREDVFGMELDEISAQVDRIWCEAYIERCGDGIVQDEEQCDGTIDCTPSCRYVTTGDTISHESIGDADTTPSGIQQADVLPIDNDSNADEAVRDIVDNVLHISPTNISSSSTNISSSLHTDLPDTNNTPTTDSISGSHSTASSCIVAAEQELCNGKDDTCDGRIDEGCSTCGGLKPIGAISCYGEEGYLGDEDIYTWTVSDCSDTYEQLPCQYTCPTGYVVEDNVCVVAEKQIFPHTTTKDAKSYEESFTLHSSTPRTKLLKRFSNMVEDLQYLCAYDDVDYTTINFQDVPRNPEHQAIDALVAYCITRGYIKNTNKEYYIREATSKAEFIKIIAKLEAWGEHISFDEEKNEFVDLEGIYKDMHAYHRYVPYVLFARDNHLLDGIGKTTFGGKKLKAFTPITGREVVRILTNAGRQVDPLLVLYDRFSRKEIADIVFEAYHDEMSDYAYFYGQNIAVYNYLIDYLAGKSSDRQREIVHYLIDTFSAMDHAYIGRTFNIHLRGMVSFLQQLIEKE